MTGILDGLKHHLVAALAELCHALIFRFVCPDLAVIFKEEKSQVNYVVSGICVTAKRVDKLVSKRMLLWMSIVFICNVGIAVFCKHLSSCVSVNTTLLHNVNQLQVTLRDGMTKDIHLRAMVVDIVLTLNLITSKGKNAA